MGPVRVRTVQVKSGQYRVASAAAKRRLRPRPMPSRPLTSLRPALPRPQFALCPLGDAASAGRLRDRQWSSGRVAGLQRSGWRHGHGLCRSAGSSSICPQAVQQGGSINPPRCIPAGSFGVGALSSESEARIRLDAARDSARGVLGGADPFTEPVGKGSRKLYRARFAGLDRDQAEAVCKTLKRSEISCITIRN